MKRHALALSVVCALLGATPALAHNDADECSARLERPPQVTAVFADPLSLPTAVEPFTLRLRDVSDSRCAFRISFEDESGRDGLRRQGGRARLDYRIALDAAGSTIIFDSEQPNSAFHATGPFGLDGRVTLYLIVDLGSRGREGLYRETIRAKVLAGGERRPVDEADIQFAARVPSHVQAFLSGTPSADGGYALLDLQELTTGETAQAMLRVFATGDFSVSFESEHEGRLAHEDDEDAYVPYEFSADGETVNLNAALQQRSRGGTSHGNGHDEDRRSVEIPLSVRIGDVTRAPAGEYRDRITITVTAQ